MIRFWYQLLPTYIFTKPVFFGTYFWALLVHFADSINNDSGNVIIRIVIVTVLHAGVYGALFLLKHLLLDRVKPGLLPSLTLVTLAVIGLSRGFFFENWLFAWDISSNKDVGLRMQTSLVNTASSFSVGIITTANSHMHQIKNAYLLNELDRLESIKIDALSRIKLIDSEAIESIKGELQRYVRSMDGRSVSDLLLILRTMIDAVVQPLSHQLEAQGNNWQPPASRDVKIQVNWLQAFRNSLNPGKIKYKLIPILMVASSLPTVIQNSTIGLLILSLVAPYFAGYLVGKFFAYLFANKSVDFSAYLLATLSTGLAMGISSLPLTQNYEAPYGFLILCTVSYPISASFISMVLNADEQLAIASKELAEATEELEWNVARIRERQHQNQRNLARVLHGSIQAKLASAYLELEKIKLENKDDPERVNQILAEIQESIATVNSRQPELVDLSTLIAKTAENWASVAAVSSQVLENELKLIQQDVLCVVALIDVIPELVFNAIKHGKADTITISINLKDQRVVELTVQDNGVHELIDLRSGLGTKIMNESAISWNRERINGRTVTTAKFAYSLEKALLN
ncbi:HATPase_UhpB-NarQ-NarX-like domain containing protein [Candidatus Nanopelagicaceae bacterium]